jgi:hypothetical protein
MHVKTGLVIPMMAAMSVRAGQAESTEKDQQKVVVYWENASVPVSVLFPAKALAAQILAGVGVRIDWRQGQRTESQLLREDAIAVRLARISGTDWRLGVPTAERRPGDVIRARGQLPYAAFWTFTPMKCAVTTFLRCLGFRKNFRRRCQCEISLRE